MKSILSILLFVVVYGASAQPLRSVYTTNYEARHKMPNQYVREADVMWSKTVWRMLDLRQKKNHHLFFPTQKRGKYMSLSDVLLDLVKKQGISVYQENAGDEFGLSMTNKDLEERLGKKGEWIQIQDPLSAETHNEFIVEEYNTSDIKRYLIKEIWFFDKNRSQMDVRIVGICPIREYFRDEVGEVEPKYKKIGWFYFPEIEKYLVNYPAMNGMNEAWKWTYYDVLKNRYFSSIIVQVGNMFDDRAINEYASGTDALLESQRIEDQIRNFESDLWAH